MVERRGREYGLRRFRGLVGYREDQGVVTDHLLCSEDALRDSGSAAGEEDDALILRAKLLLSLARVRFGDQLLKEGIGAVRPGVALPETAYGEPETAAALQYALSLPGEFGAENQAAAAGRVYGPDKLAGHQARVQRQDGYAQLLACIPDYQPFRAALHEQRQSVSAPEPFELQGVGKPVAFGVQLGVCKLAILAHDSGPVRKAVGVPKQKIAEINHLQPPKNNSNCGGQAMLQIPMRFQRK